MSVMCSLAVCKAQEGMCGHEKVMLSIALLAAVGLGAAAIKPRPMVGKAACRGVAAQRLTTPVLSA